jgi:hypothetical protein
MFSECNSCNGKRYLNENSMCNVCTGSGYLNEHGEPPYTHWEYPEMCNESFE